MQDIEETEVSFTDAPTEGEQSELTKLGMELVDTLRRIAIGEKLLAELKDRERQLSMRELPEYMTRIGQDKCGLPEAGVDLVKSAYYKANISAEWEEEKREKAFGWLEDNGHGDIIRATLVVSAGKGSIDALKRMMPEVQAMLDEEGLDAEISVAKSVPWNTLTAFVKEQVEAGKPVDLDLLGATVGSIVKMKKRN